MVLDPRLNWAAFYFMEMRRESPEIEVACFILLLHPSYKSTSRARDIPIVLFHFVTADLPSILSQCERLHLCSL